MTDTPVPAVTTTTDAFANYVVEEAARDRLRANLLPANKAAIFDALADAGIVAVVVGFDGCGDSGQIEAVDARDASGDVALPDAIVERSWPSYANYGVERQALPLPDAIEKLCYDLLEAEHGGWENNDGAYGEFTFDVATRLVSLEHNVRYTAVESYSHQF